MSKSLFTIGIETLKKHEVRDYFDELKRPVGRAATHAVREAGDNAKDRLRSEVRRKFRKRLEGGSDFANSFRAYHSPKKNDPRFQFSYEPATTVLAAAPWAEVFEEGAVIRPEAGNFALAIPLDSAEQLGLTRNPFNGHRQSLTGKARKMFGELHVAELEDGRAFLAADEGGESLFLFRLVRSVREPKKLSFRASVEWAARFMPADFAEELARLSPR